MRPFEVPEEKRAAYHAAAAMASNLLVALEESAAEVLARIGIEDPRELLAPLVLRTAANWAERGPDALTGPIARGDRATVQTPSRRPRRERARARPPLRRARDACGGHGLGIRPRSVLMKILRSRAELRDALAGPRHRGRRIGLVPTMGYFHEGHLSLMRRAREDCEIVVVSLFVNPAQFGEGEDLDAYPRDENRDAELAAREGVDLLWIPDVEHMYPEGFATTVEVTGELTDVLEGDPEQRGPSHFRGVTTVVAKLFNSVQPDVAYFGRKDAQQAVVIRADGPRPRLPGPDRGAAHGPRGGRARAELAQRLPRPRTARARGRDLSRAAGRRAGGAGGRDLDRRPGRARDRTSFATPASSRTTWRRASAEDLSPIAELNGRPVLVAVAARVGRARLIDNVVIAPPTTETTEA